MLNIIIYNHIWWIILMHIKLHITTCRTLHIVIVVYYMLFILIHRLELIIIVKYFVTKLLYSLAEMMQHKKGVYILANLNHAHRSWVLLFTCKMGMFIIYLHIACKPQNTLDTWGRVWLKKKKMLFQTIQIEKNVVIFLLMQWGVRSDELLFCHRNW